MTVTPQEILQKLVSFPTISSDSNRDCVDYIVSILEPLGAKIQIVESEDRAKANIWATFGPDTQGGVVFSGHTDVVPVEGQPWETDPFTLTENDGKLHGRGSCDMKGFIACVLAMAPRLKEVAVKRPVHFSFTYDEEVGYLGAIALTDWLRAMGRAPSMVLVGEPTMMKMVDAHKGVYEHTTTFTGLEGHGSNPDAGVNAADYAADFVLKLREIGEKLKSRAPADSPFSPPYSTMNVGAINGGFAHNVIPAKTEILWDFRPINAADMDFLHKEVTQYLHDVVNPAMKARDPNAGAVDQVDGAGIGFPRHEKNRLRDIIGALTGQNSAGTVAFGTEAGLFQNLGADVVVFGPGSIEQAHKANEYIEKSQLDACMAFLEAFARSEAFA